MVKERDDSNEKVVESINMFGLTGEKEKVHIECVNQVSLDNHKKLSRDVLTRWNSDFLIFHGTLYYHCAFLPLRLTDSNYKHFPFKKEQD